MAVFLCAASFAQTDGAPVSNISVEPPVSHAMTAAVCPVVGSGFYQLGAVFRLTTLQSDGVPKENIDAPQGLAQHTISASSESTATGSSDGTAALTARDICALAQAGALAEIERHTLLSSYSPKQNSSASDILQELLSTIAQTKAASHTALAAPSTTEARDAQLLRFKVNGQDVLKRCAALYVSPSQEGRAFLLSFDSEQTDEESALTLHLLFKPSGEFLHYKVAACTASQVSEEASFAKVFAVLGDMEAFRTGSIVSLKSTTDGARVDLLIDLGDEAN